MSVVFVVVPVVAGAWPIVSAAVVAACAGMGYAAVRHAEENALLLGEYDGSNETRSVLLTMEDSAVVTDALSRGDSFTFARGDITATFRVDGRGACTVHVAGRGRSNAELEAEARDLMDRVRQQYAYAKVMGELEERGFQVVGQEVAADRSIRIRVRR